MSRQQDTAEENLTSAGGAGADSPPEEADGRKRVLVVDDEEGVRELLGEVLEDAGYSCSRVQDGLRALSRLASETRYDLIFSDISMPGLDGIDLLRTVKSVAPVTPVILVSGNYEWELGLDALRLGAADYLYKPVKRAAILEMARKHIGPGVRRDETILQDSLSRILSEAGSSPASTERVIEMFSALGLRRYETLQHSRRVADYSLLLGRQHGLSDQELEDLRLGALLHDAGKIAIPHNVLMKPGALNEQEWRVMHMHPQLGWEMLRPFTVLETAAEIVRCHHERWDGKGYPKGLAGGAIPIGARIFSVIDTLDAMISDRPYRKGCSVADARAEIRSASGSQFDPAVVSSFMAIPDLHLVSIKRRHSDENSDRP